MAIRPKAVQMECVAHWASQNVLPFLLCADLGVIAIIFLAQHLNFKETKTDVLSKCRRFLRFLL